MSVYTLRGRRFVGLRVGRFYITFRDIRHLKPLFTERHRIRCRYVTLGNWRLAVKSDSPSAKQALEFLSANKEKVASEK